MSATLGLRGAGIGGRQKTDFVKWAFWLGEYRVASPIRVWLVRLSDLGSVG